MNVSIAICTWNRASLLARTLDEMTKIRVPSGLSWELLVINNNCTDTTNEVVHQFEGRLPIRLLFENAPGLSHARNLALIEAKGAWLIFTDGDVLVEPQWIGAGLETAQRFPTGAVVGGRVTPWVAV